jgi:hypothetical protein
LIGLTVLVASRVTWGEFFKSEFAPTQRARAYAASLLLRNGGARLSWCLCGQLARRCEFVPMGVLKNCPLMSLWKYRPTWSPTHFCQNNCIYLPVVKKIFTKSTRRKSSPSRQKFAQSGVDVMITIFGDFRQFSAEKIGVFLKNQCYDQIFCKN